MIIFFLIQQKVLNHLTAQTKKKKKEKYEKWKKKKITLIMIIGEQFMKIKRLITFATIHQRCNVFFIIVLFEFLNDLKCWSYLKKKKKG